MAPTRDITITVPTVEGIIKWLSIAYDATVVKHRILSGCALILWSYYPKVPFKAVRYVAWDLPNSIFLGCLRCLGFGGRGVEGDRRYQSTYYGGYIPEDSYFSYYQSYGAQRFDEDYDTTSESGLWGAFGWGLFICGMAALMAHSPTKE